MLNGCRCKSRRAFGSRLPIGCAEGTWSNADRAAALREARDAGDGHYQIYLKPTRSSDVERTVLDVYIKQGQPIDFAVFEEDAGDSQGAPQGGQPGAGGDQTRLQQAERSRATSGSGKAGVSQLPVDAALIAGELLAQPLVPSIAANTEPEHETADARGTLRAISQVPLVGAAIACEGLRRRWQRQTEAEVQQAKNRPLTKAGRLYARLRRQAEQSFNSVSE